MTGDPADTAGPDRRAQLGSALRQLRGRIAAACRDAGRDAGEVELVAVTKFHPALDVATLLDLGVLAFGESRPQEAAAKAEQVAQLRPDAGPRWHLVGRLQRNKARSVVGWASRVESVDSARLVDALDAAVRRAVDRGDRAAPLPVLLQLSLDGDPARGGLPRRELSGLADRVARAEGLALRGLMAVAPRTGDLDHAFAALQTASAALRSDFPDADVLSAGMTGDLERAIRHGSTCVRVGTALLGDRRLASA
ncbi:MAG TPA: YggS family pyridoxal phosphate-dependent enzyme [Pseudonocardia sp.]|uniref:YggS family pyridoxal phosphate-dependent enzyme n=1 Tax=Pseudonocardia sp. TaxID=60912 RepID=UPI002F42B96A